MEDWTGFTDEELQKLKRQASDTKDVGRYSAHHQGGTNRQGSHSKKPSTKRTVSRITHNQQVVDSVPQDAMLAPPKPKPKKIENNKSHSNSRSHTMEAPQKKSYSEKESAECPNKDHNVKEVKEINEKEALKQQLSQVEQYQLQQRMMEEQNKRKKQMLSSAIIERQKKATAEAGKLKRIQLELSTLDQLLSIDVSLIRDRIEDASREFLDAQKRYEKAEQEYIEAKIDLHKKSELKNDLTEHLYTIIQQNEIRKAKKLTELMEKLNMDNDEEVEEIHLELTGLPHMMTQATVLSSLVTPRTLTKPGQDTLSDDVNRGETTMANVQPKSEPEIVAKDLIEKEDGSEPPRDIKQLTDSTDVAVNSELSKTDQNKNVTSKTSEEETVSIKQEESDSVEVEQTAS